MENNFLKEEVLRISGVNPLKCMRCGKCSATCPAYDEMEYHPHQFVYMVEKGEIEELMKSKSIYRCLSCFASGSAGCGKKAVFLRRSPRQLGALCAGGEHCGGSKT